MKSILIADDDKFFRDQLSNYFIAGGYDVNAVENGRDAVNALITGNFDALVLDVYMEGISGLQTIAIVKKIKPKLPIIIITGDNSLELERKIRSCGVYCYLVKPFEMGELGEIIHSAVKADKLNGLK
jgi:DNA-binding NtrC family response regulator